MVSLWDVLPVVVNSLGGAGCRCRMVCHSSSGEGVAVVVSDGGRSMCCLSVSLWGVWPVAVDWLPVVAVVDGEPVGWSACGCQFPRHSASVEPVPWSLSVGW